MTTEMANGKQNAGVTFGCLREGHEMVNTYSFTGAIRQQKVYDWPPK